MVTTAEDMLKRSPGEDIYGAKSPNQRAAEQLTKDMIEMDDMITRREESMCAQALFEEKLTLLVKALMTPFNIGRSLPRKISQRLR